ncbi:hypothetical protein Tco_1413473 [Tanacetum coccineum]
MDIPLGLGDGVARRRVLELAEEIAPSTFKAGQSSKSAPDQHVADMTPTPRILVRTTWIDLEDGDVYLDIEIDPQSYAPLELHESILHDHTQRLDERPPSLFEGYDQDLRKLYTRSRVVRDEIFSQCYRLRNLEQEQERATVTFGALWRPVLALELIHDLLVQHTTMQRELQEIRDRVAALEQERSRREQ